MCQLLCLGVGRDISDRFQDSECVEVVEDYCREHTHKYLIWKDHRLYRYLQNI